MKNLKTIAFKWRCRGRPPTRGDTRAGPCAIGQLDNWTVGQLDSWTVGQKMVDVRLEPETWNLEPGTWNRGSPGEFAVQRRRRYKYRVPDPELKHINSRLRTKDSRLRTKDSRLRTKDLRLSHARDWVSFTCSVNWLIRRDRDKDRWKDMVEPAESGGTGKVCPGGNVE